MFDIEGYCIIKTDATTGKGTKPESFLGKTVRVVEFGKHDGCVLVVNNEATAMCMFDKEDIARSFNTIHSFKCGQVGDVVTPPGLNPIEQMMYASKAMARKGGYNHIVRQMVIASSLHRGEFCDSILWAKQDEPSTEEAVVNEVVNDFVFKKHAKTDWAKNPNFKKQAMYPQYEGINAMTAKFKIPRKLKKGLKTAIQPWDKKGLRILEVTKTSYNYRGYEVNQYKGTIATKFKTHLRGY